jgi:hypothetical protein
MEENLDYISAKSSSRTPSWRTRPAFGALGEVKGASVG